MHRLRLFICGLLCLSCAEGDSPQGPDPNGIEEVSLYNLERMDVAIDGTIVLPMREGCSFSGVRSITVDDAFFGDSLHIEVSSGVCPENSELCSFGAVRSTSIRTTTGIDFTGVTSARLKATLCVQLAGIAFHNRVSRAEGSIWVEPNVPGANHLGIFAFREQTDDSNGILVETDIDVNLEHALPLSRATLEIYISEVYANCGGGKATTATVHLSNLRVVGTR